MAWTEPEGVIFRDGRPMSTTESGVPYVTMVTGKLIQEGTERYPTAPEADAWAAFDTGLRMYLTAEHAKVVEWRVRPEVIRHLDRENVSVRARLAVVERTDG